jgi:Ca2+-binding RTX toxin-like protein
MEQQLGCWNVYMLLSTQSASTSDERTLGDSTSRSGGFQIALNQTSYGSLSASDVTDYFAIRPGAGVFAIFVTADPANGFDTVALQSDFNVRITSADGAQLLTSNPSDLTTRLMVFNSDAADQTFFVEITNLSGRAMSYAATLQIPVTLSFDVLNGDAGANSMSGSAANDSMSGQGGDDTIMGGGGVDYIDGGPGRSYLRGDDGNDRLQGGADFDDINGNMGNDTASGGLGDDWVVGGKDNDLLYGDAGGDVVWGNLGNDNLDGGDGIDQVRGGQGDDIVIGGAGDDYVSGDRGSDTVVGGSGADLFHSFGDAGVDRVLDFHQSEGDRVMLDPGTIYDVAQEGSDTVITMAAGAKMTLVGVTLSSLTTGWIFLG